jgi:hypothetical protein
MVILTLQPPYSLARIFLCPLKRELGNIQSLSKGFMAIHIPSLPTGDRTIFHQ